MTSRTLSIVEEFVRSPEAEDRKNAAAALAALGQPESVARLIGIALAEKEPDVRKRAEAETLSLKGEALDTAVGELYRALDDADHKEKRINAHGILGRLRANGMALTPPRLSLLSKFRLAFSLHRYLYHPRRWRFRARAWKWGALGGLFGSIISVFLSGFITRWEWNEDSLASLGLTTTGVGLSIASSVAVTQRSCPINLQLNSRAGGLVDALVAMAYFTVVVTLITILTVATIVAMGQKNLPLKEVTRVLSLIIVIFASVVGAIRAGTIIGYGLFRNRSQNKLAQTVIGVITALLLMAIIFFLTEPDSSAISGEWGSRLSRLLITLVYPGDEIRLFWLIFIPAVSGLAYTFATIDSESFSTRPIHGRIAKAICYALTIVFSALLIFTLYLGYRESKLVLTGHQGFVSNLVFSRDARFLAVGVRWGEGPKLWEIGTLTAVNISPPKPRAQGDESAAREAPVVRSEPRPFELSAIAYSPDGKLLAMGGVNGLVFLWDTTKRQWYHPGNEENSLAPAKDSTNSSILETVSSLAFSLDDQILVSGHMNGLIRFWETKTMKEIVGEIQEKPAPGGSINFIVFRPEGRQFLAIAADAVYLWDFEARKVLSKLITLDKDFRGITVSANGKLAAGMTSFGMIGLWDLDKGQEMATISMGSQAPNYLLALSADGHLLATGGSNGMPIKLWNTMTQRQIAELYHHELYMESLAFSPDGKLLAVGGFKVVRLLDVSKWTKP